MAAPANIIKQTDINIRSREIDFVTQFARNWDALKEILGIMRPIRKTPGTILKSKYAVGTLQSGTVAEGESVPYSKFEVKEKDYGTIGLEKYRKGVTAESIAEHGYDAAVAMTDDEFLVELQENVTTRFYNYLKTGTLAITETSWKRAIAMSIGKVKSKFKQMHRTATGVAIFVNTMDLYDYLGDAELTIQTAFGLDYIKNFMGADIVFITDEVESGKVIATPVNNIVLYYIDPNDGDFAKAGLVFTTDGETNLIGFHVEGNYDRFMGESFAFMGIRLFAEYIDAIAVTTITPAP